MRDTEYFASRALSKSAIDLLLECPAYYKAWYDNVADEKKSPAMVFGSMFHMLTLEPESFNASYAVATCSLTTKAGKEWKDSLPSDVAIIKNEEFETALHMREAIWDHPQAKYLFQDYIAEHPIFWETEGIVCKAKPDMVATIQGIRFVADLKTTESANPETLSRTIHKYGYHRQAAWYLAGLAAVGMPCQAFFFVFVEKQYPHLVTMCQLDETALARGREECSRAVSILKECEKTGVYPCFTRDIVTVSLPGWA